MEKIHLLAKSINEENIELLVREFYLQVIQDSTLSPFFINKLGKDIRGKLWEDHLVLLIEFWKFVALDYENYNGNPLAPHFLIAGINKDSFARWLTLFHATVDTLYTASSGQFFKDKSTDIAENFMRKLQLEK